MVVSADGPASKVYLLKNMCGLCILIANMFLLAVVVRSARLSRAAVCCGIRVLDKHQCWCLEQSFHHFPVFPRVLFLGAAEETAAPPAIARCPSTEGLGDDTAGGAQR